MLEVGGVVVGVVVALAALYKALPGAWGFVKAAARVPATIEAIYHEFSPNEGGSLRDAVNRIEGDVGELKERVSTLEAK